MKVYIIRQGQTTGDIEDRYGGNYDDHLTEEGEKQSMALANKLKDEGIQIIMCSPLIRGRETAKILQNLIGCDVRVWDDLKERNQYGILTGQVKSGAKEKYFYLVEKLKDYRNTIDGAESYRDFKKRIEKVFQNLSNTGGFSTIAIITHGGPIRTIFREILKVGEINVVDCGYAVLNKNGFGFKIEKMDGIVPK